MTAHKASVHKIGKGNKERSETKLYPMIYTYTANLEGLVVRWNTDGTQYAILFERQLIIYNVAVC
jgi:hypothetical protein